MTDKYVSELPKCKLCGCDPLPIEAAYMTTFCGNKSCTMRKGFYTEQQWRSLMGEPEPASAEPQRETRTRVPDNVTRVRDAATGEVVWEKPVSAEPVAWCVMDQNGKFRDQVTTDKDRANTWLGDSDKNLLKLVPLYTHPPAQQWIMCSERMPEYQAHAGSDNFAIVLASFQEFVVEAMYCNGEWKSNTFPGVAINPTHWMPLPQPPEVG